VGSNVAKAGFRQQWRGLSATKPVALGKDIDAISGATYSSRAVADGTNRIVDLLNSQREEILSAIAESRAAAEEATS
jgi:Na+-translocating ferredoxin:NAD+ oxidoreductase RnfG subunit